MSASVFSLSPSAVDSWPWGPRSATRRSSYTESFIMDPKLIDLYESGGGKLQRSITGLSNEDLLWVPPPDAQIGSWSIQQIVIHLMDADLIGTNRMKSIIAEENPTILGYDESKFAASLFYEAQNAESSIGLLDLNRKQFAKVLRKLPDSSF